MARNWDAVAVVLDEIRWSPVSRELSAQVGRPRSEWVFWRRPGAHLCAKVERSIWFFWWSIHFLLGGRESWRRVRPDAVATALFWTGLGVFAAFYFSTTIVDDSKTYGTIGVTFTLITWFIAMGLVIMLGTVFGAVWQKRRSGIAIRQPSPN
jgi:uncharacterized BrkB/YihY/UPF0761 family membrane protein